MDLEIERLFQEKFLSQTKNLANGKKIKIFSRKLHMDGSFIYSCHLCGATEVGNEHDLHIHVKGQLHSSLMELKIIPLRSWMESVVISDETEKKPCALGCGDCSDLKELLESVCGIKSEVKKEKEKKTTNSNFSNMRKSSHPRSRRETEEKSRERKRVNSPSRKRHRNMREEEKFRSRSPSRPQSRKSSYSRRQCSNSYEGSRRTSVKEVHVTKDSSSRPKKLDYIPNKSNVNPTTFLSVCRFLVTLEQHISKFSTEINSLFSSSLNLERQETGASNQLLTNNTLKFMAKIKRHLKDQIVLGMLPMKMLTVARSFVNEFDQLVQENELKCSPTVDKQKKMLIDYEMTS